MAGEASCPRCDASVPFAEAVCPRCGFVLMEERLAARGPRALLVAATAIAATVAGLILFAAPPALTPSSDALPAAEAERRLAARYPHLRYSEHAVIACPERAIPPGGAARCWVLARVGLQRSVIVRLSRRGNRVEFED
jgi:hypothetical protein